MIKKYEELTIKDINNIKFLGKEDLKKLSFAELCIYLENLNKINKRYQELIGDKGE